MADITMCTQKLCPNAGHCLRRIAQPSKFQSWCMFEYGLSPQGVVCDFYIPACITTTTDTVKEND